MPMDGESYDGDINAWKDDNFELGGFPTTQRDGVPVHTFRDTGRCYNETQCNEKINDGDVLLIPSENVVGFLNKAWPCAVTVETGNLHGLLPEFVGSDDHDEYRQQIAVAVAIAEDNGWDVGMFR